MLDASHSLVLCRIAGHATRTPHKLALVAGERRITYSQLAMGIEAGACYLQSLGITKGDYEMLVDALPDATIIYKHDESEDFGTESRRSDDEDTETDTENEYGEEGEENENGDTSSRERESSREGNESRGGTPSTNGYWFENDYTGGYAFYSYDDGQVYNDGEGGYHYNGEPV